MSQPMETGMPPSVRGRPPGSTKLESVDARHILLEILDSADREPLRFWDWVSLSSLIESCCPGLSAATHRRYVNEWGLLPPVAKEIESGGARTRKERAASPAGMTPFEDWMRREYPGIKRQCKRESHAIFWIGFSILPKDVVLGHGRQGLYGTLYVRKNKGPWTLSVVRGYPETAYFAAAFLPRALQWIAGNATSGAAVLIENRRCYYFSAVRDFIAKAGFSVQTYPKIPRKPGRHA